jgi:hypothetical protein
VNKRSLKSQFENMKPKNLTEKDMNDVTDDERKTVIGTGQVLYIHTPLDLEVPREKACMSFFGQNARRDTICVACRQQRGERPKLPSKQFLPEVFKLNGTKGLCEDIS